MKTHDYWNDSQSRKFSEPSDFRARNLNKPNWVSDGSFCFSSFEYEWARDVECWLYCYFLSDWKLVDTKSKLSRELMLCWIDWFRCGVTLVLFWKDYLGHATNRISFVREAAVWRCTLSIRVKIIDCELFSIHQ